VTDLETLRKEHMDAFDALLRVFVEVIQEATDNGLYGGMPSGHLYAMVMGKMNQETYRQAIHILRNIGHITQEGQLLRVTDKGRTWAAK